MKQFNDEVEVSYAFPTSINADLFGYSSTGCWCVAIRHRYIGPNGAESFHLRLVSGHLTRPEAEQAADVYALPRGYWDVREYEKRKAQRLATQG